MCNRPAMLVVCKDSGKEGTETHRVFPLIIFLHTKLGYDERTLTLLSHHIKLKIKAKLMCGARDQGTDDPRGWGVVTRW